MSGRPPSWRMWSDAEKALLKAAWARGGITEARRVLPLRSETSLHLQAGRLGCLSPRQWSAEEVEQLVQANAAGGLDAACAALPNRSRRSCSDKLYRLSVDARGEGVVPALPPKKSCSILAAKAEHDLPPPSAVPAAPRRRAWTTRDIQLLTEAWRSGGIEAAVEAFPHRSRSAVVTRGRQMKLRVGAQKLAWDRTDSEMLRALYPRVGAVEAAQRMTWRSPMAISEQARKLGLRVRRASMAA